MTTHADAANEFADNAGPPLVDVTRRHIGDYVDETADLLVATNKPPTLFVRGDGIAEFDGERLVPLDQLGLLDAVERRLRIVRRTATGDVVPVTLTGPALGLVLRRLRTKLPHVERLAAAPFLRTDGSICHVRGYDPPSRLYLLDDLAVDVSDRPTCVEVAEAVAELDDLFVDFPFRDDASKAHAWSLVLTEATRHHYSLAPCHAVTGNNAGVGKGLLVEVALRATIGDAAATTDALPLEADEQRKAITSKLAAGTPAVLWDEAHVLAGTEVARLLTSHIWRDRLLGTNTSIEAPNTLTTVALGNHMRILGDLRRRVVLIELETDLANPERRNGFRHPDLKAYATEQRGSLLSAILTILRAWHVAGRPSSSTAVLGSFEPWAATVGGILEFIGVKGFLANRDATAELDEDALEFAWHLVQLRQAFGTVEFQVADVLGQRDLDTPGSIDRYGRDAGRDLGNLYRRNTDRPYEVDCESLRVRRARGLTGGKARWRVETVAGPSATEVV